MKKYIYKFLLLSFIVLFISCELNNANEGDYDNTNPRSGWIEFSETSSQVLNDSGSALLPVELNVDINDSDTQVTYIVEVISGQASNAQTGTFSTIVESGELDGFISYELDPTISSNYTLQFTILDTSNSNVIVGLEGDNPIVYTLEVCDNSSFPLNWVGTTYFDNNIDDPVDSIEVTLTPTGNDNEYLIDNAWGDFVAALTGNPAFEGQFVYDAVVTRDPVTNTISMVGATDPDTFPGTVPLGDERLEDSDFANFYDPCTKEMRYLLTQEVFVGDFTVGVILTPAP